MQAPGLHPCTRTAARRQRAKGSATWTVCASQLEDLNRRRHRCRLGSFGDGTVAVAVLAGSQPAGSETRRRRRRRPRGATVTAQLPQPPTRTWPFRSAPRSARSYARGRFAPRRAGGRRHRDVRSHLWGQGDLCGRGWRQSRAVTVLGSRPGASVGRGLQNSGSLKFQKLSSVIGSPIRARRLIGDQRCWTKSLRP